MPTGVANKRYTVGFKKKVNSNDEQNSTCRLPKKLRQTAIFHLRFPRLVPVWISTETSGTEAIVYDTVYLSSMCYRFAN